jgi:GT2 family glycosyltransferase
MLDSTLLPTISLILPTLEREEVLCDTLKYLLAQTYSKLEIIIVDQTPQHQPATEAFLRELASAGRMKHVCTMTHGLTVARNVGIEHAQGEVILFCDDDVIVGPDWVASHAENYLDPTIGGVTGQVLEPNQTPGDVKPIGRITYCGRLIENFYSIHRMDVEYVKGGNMSFRRTVAHKVGLFDTRFGNPAFLEETDFAFRVRKLGYRIVFDPQASMRHLAWPRGGAQARLHDRVSRFYYFLLYKTLFMLKNLPPWQWPCCLAVCLGRAVFTGLIQARSLQAFYRLAFQALWDGYCLYRQSA